MKILDEQQLKQAVARRRAGCLGAFVVPVFAFAIAFLGRSETVANLAIVGLAMIPISLAVWLWYWGKIAEHAEAQKYAEMDNPPEVVYNPEHGLYFFFAFASFVGGLIGLFFAIKNLFVS